MVLISVLISYKHMFEHALKYYFTVVNFLDNKFLGLEEVCVLCIKVAAILEQAVKIKELKVSETAHQYQCTFRPSTYLQKPLYSICHGHMLPHLLFYLSPCF